MQMNACDILWKTLKKEESSWRWFLQRNSMKYNGTWQIFCILLSNLEKRKKKKERFLSSYYVEWFKKYYDEHLVSWIIFFFLRPLEPVFLYQFCIYSISWTRRSSLQCPPSSWRDFVLMPWCCEGSGHPGTGTARSRADHCQL